MVGKFYPSEPGTGERGERDPAPPGAATLRAILTQDLLGSTAERSGQSIKNLQVNQSLMARRSRSLVPLRFQVQLALSTLGNDTALLVGMIPAIQQDFDIITTHLLVAMREHTAGEGPVEFGMAASDYTTTEVVECLDATPLRNSGVEMERSRRKVRTYGQISGAAADEVPNDGLPIKRRMFLRIAAGMTTGNFFAVNRSGSALTTGSILEITGVHWGRWK